MRIQKIHLNNFRSFRSLNEIDLGNQGKNLFLYGENGSGKSSFCRALNFFFEATDNRRSKNLINKHLKNNEFKNIENLDDKYISLFFTNSISIRLDEFGYNSTEKIETLNNIRRTKGFLEYKNLVPIYLTNKTKNNLFRLFVEGPFSTLRNPITKKLISTQWNNRKSEDLNQDFYKGVFQLAKNLEEKTNSILKYFDPSLTISFKTRKTWTTGEIYAEVSILDHTLTNYNDYFNEAKLVALSISIYLAIILKQGEQHNNDNLKILILDDIFIGMDLGNRIPLLKIINDIFYDYQVFITTFDENWYKMAKFYLKDSKWKFLKAYTGNESKVYPKTFLFDNEKEDYLNKALYYFDHFDYPACANYQRKFIEKKLKTILPYNLLHSSHENGTIKNNDKLSTNFTNFINYIKEAKLDPAPFSDFKLYSKIILNPLSHDNSSSPIFKMEVSSVFKIIEELNNIETKTIIETRPKEVKILKLSIKDNNENWFQYKFQVVDNLRRISHKQNEGYSKCRVILTAKKKGKSSWETIESNEKEYLEDKYLSLCKHHNIESGDYLNEYKTNNKISLYNLNK